MDNVKPALGVRSRRVGGATYQVPSRSVRTGDHPGAALAGELRQARREKTMIERLMNEILDASNGLGAAPSSGARTRTRWPKPTSAFAHYRW